MEFRAGRGGTTSFNIPVVGGVLTIETTYTTVAEEPTISDPKWKYTDKQGHQHFYAPGDNHYPSLKTVLDEPFYCKDCRETHDDFTHLECKVCGEKIVPGTTTGAPVSMASGREMTYKGSLPYKIGLEFIRWSESVSPTSMTVNGKTLLEFVEGL